MMGFRNWRRLAVTAAAILAFMAPAHAQTATQVLEQSQPADWRGLDLANTLVMTLGSGEETIIELNPVFAPATAANILTLTRAGFFDGLTINRVQDNYVTQWGDPNSDNERARPLGTAAATIPAEFTRRRERAVPFWRLRDGDVYAREVGFSNGFPIARTNREMWMTHCYGMIGVGRGNERDSGNGAELYAVIGHAPRHLDRNITLVGRVISGMAALTALPRGTGALGFYERPEQRVAIRSVRVATDLPNGGSAGRLEILRTEGQTWERFVDTRRNRRDAWFLEPTGRVEVCNIWIPTRQRPAA
jgi:peptidylprolyl isomerase